MIATKGVVIKESGEGVNKETAAKLKYPFQDIWEHGVGRHLPFMALKTVVQNLDYMPDYHGFSMGKPGPVVKRGRRR